MFKHRYERMRHAKGLHTGFGMGNGGATQDAQAPALQSRAATE